MAIASLIIGAFLVYNQFSAVLTDMLYGILYGRIQPELIGPMIGVVGLVLGILAFRRKKRRKIAMAGIVLNSIPILILFAPM